MGDLIKKKHIPPTAKKNRRERGSSVLNFILRKKSPCWGFFHVCNIFYAHITYVSLRDMIYLRLHIESPKKKEKKQLTSVRFRGLISA